jgi:hypothetical protein
MNLNDHELVFWQIDVREISSPRNKSKLLSFYDEIECNKKEGAKGNWNITQE